MIGEDFEMSWHLYDSVFQFMNTLCLSIHLKFGFLLLEFCRFEYLKPVPKAFVRLAPKKFGIFFSFQALVFIVRINQLISAVPGKGLTHARQVLCLWAVPQPVFQLIVNGVFSLPALLRSLPVYRHETHLGCLMVSYHAEPPPLLEESLLSHLFHGFPEISLEIITLPDKGQFPFFLSHLTPLCFFFLPHGLAKNCTEHQDCGESIPGS